MCAPTRAHILAERDGLGGVTLCGCGTLHLAVGGITLRLAPETFQAMLVMCQDAAQRLLVEGGEEPLPTAGRVIH